MKAKETSSIEHNLRVPSYENNQEKEFPQSTRNQALAWWKDLKNENKIKLSKKYYPYLSGSTTLLNQYEIELIWLKETQKDYSDVAEAAKKLSNTIEELRKPNQKQFKQFDGSLFKSYIDKFSDEDKLKCIEILMRVTNTQKCHLLSIGFIHS